MVQPGTMDVPRYIGRYKVLYCLGRGGMGAVYLARDMQLDRQVAVKVPHVSAIENPRSLERFYREARAAATLQHPNLCPVYDVGESAGRPFLTMAFIEGKPLSAYVQRGRPQPQRQAAILVRKLARAVQEAHNKEVIHRDLKPDNIMINKRREPIIMDFGLACLTRQEETRLTREGAILGTPSYMAPEQMAGDREAIGPGCDIYSLGVILYELLTGRLPYEGPVTAVLCQIMTQEPPRPSSYRPDLDPALEAICLKAMARRLDARYQSMSAFAIALGDWLRDAAPTLATNTPDKDANDDNLVGNMFAEPAAATETLSPSASNSGLQPAPGGGWLLATLAVFLLIIGGIALSVTQPWRWTGPFADPTSNPDPVAGGGALDTKTTVRENPPPQATTVDPKLSPPPEPRPIPRSEPSLPAKEAPQATPKIESPPPRKGPAPGLFLPGAVARLRPGKNLLLGNQGGTIVRLAISANGRVAVSGGQSNGLAVWDLLTGKQRKFFPNTQDIQSLALTANGQRILVGVKGGTVLLLDTESGQPLHTWKSRPKFPAFATFSPDDRNVLFWGEEKCPVLWNESLGKPKPFPAITEGNVLVYSPDGRLFLVCARSPDVVRVCDARTGAVRATVSGMVTKVSGAFSADGKQFLVGTALNRNGEAFVNLHEALSGKLIRTFTGHKGPVSAVAFAADGQHVVSASRDGTIQVWDFDSKSPLQVFATDKGEIRSAAFSADGRFALTGSETGNVRLWRVLE